MKKSIKIRIIIIGAIMMFAMAQELFSQRCDHRGVDKNGSDCGVLISYNRQIIALRTFYLKSDLKDQGILYAQFSKDRIGYARLNNNSNITLEVEKGKIICYEKIREIHVSAGCSEEIEDMMKRIDKMKERIEKRGLKTK